MPFADYKDTKDFLPITIPEQVKMRLASDGLAVKQRLPLVGISTLLELGDSRILRTADIANRCGVTEATLYRHFPSRRSGRNNLIDTMIGLALACLRDDIYPSRYRALSSLATRLAADQALSQRDALNAWTNVYGAIANPSTIFNLGLVPQGNQELGVMIADHARMISGSVRAIGEPSGIPVRDNFGVAIVPLVATWEAEVGEHELGRFAFEVISKALQS